MLLVDCSFLLAIHWACKAGESTECRGGLVFAVAGMLRHPRSAPPFFFGMPMHEAESGGAVLPFDLPTLPSGDNNRSSPIVGRVSKN